MLETPSGKLADVRVTLSLARDSISLRLHYEWFEMVVPVFVVGMENTAVAVASAALGTLSRLDDQVAGGNLTVQAQAHLQLVSADPDSYLNEQMNSSVDASRPDAFARTLLELDEHKQGRIVVARSIPFEGALFVDYIGEFGRAEFSPALVEQLQAEYRYRLRSLGLEPLESSDGVTK